MEPVNELDHILQFLEAHGVKMAMIAKDLDLEYDYIKGQKTLKDPEKQSEKLVRNVRIRYADILKDMPPYKGNYTSKNPNHELKEEALSYIKLSELDAAEEDLKEKGIEKDQLLHSIYKSLQDIKSGQQEIIATQQVHAKQIAKLQSNGDEKQEQELIQKYKLEAELLIAATKAQEPGAPESPQD